MTRSTYELISALNAFANEVDLEAFAQLTDDMDYHSVRLFVARAFYTLAKRNWEFINH